MHTGAAADVARERVTRRWLDQDPVLEKHGSITVVRDDLVEGGSKLRFLPFLTAGAKEVVFGGPCCGGAPYALSVLARETGLRVTLFFAKRKQKHWKQRAELRNGARIFEVSPGYMTNVQAKARAYAEQAGALFLPLGFDVSAAVDPFCEAIARVRARVGNPDQVWCATGSGMLARCLASVFTNSEICGVTVGLASRHEAQAFPRNVRLVSTRYSFEQEARERCPFPSDPNYDRKAWAECEKHSRGSVLFWNVAGNATLDSA